MRTALIALVLVLLASAASAQPSVLNNKVEGLVPNLKVDVPKPVTEDTLLDATLVEEGGVFSLDLDMILVQQYQPYELRVWIYGAPTKDGPWSKLVDTYWGLSSPAVGTNSVHIPLLREPELGFLRVSLVVVQDGQSQPVHAQKMYELYYTGVQIKN